MNNPVAWFEIYVQDMPRAKAFYQTVFQVELTPISTPEDAVEMWAFASSMEHGAPGALCKMEGVPPSNGLGTLVYFKCDDCATEAVRAAENGGKIFKEKMAIGEHGFIALVNDTEGNMIGLHSK